MDYFLLKQDERYTDVPLLLDLMKKIDLRSINQMDAHKIEDTTLFYVRAEEESSFLDILDRQLYLVSDGLKKILEKYVPNTLFKMMILIDKKNERQENYFLPIFEEVEALSPNCEFNLDKSVIKKLVLDGEKIKGKKIFKIKESEKPMIVVRLDAAESILRRGFEGIRLEKIQVE
ncbi:imm11 family protein [Clostridium sp. DJ247]|uniref:imm11 family protein n=1 Tax=Clostridium sp. DJ247 TaxID=2726188 RepID=UPI0016248B25|nr:hypothetical protein [Clostridium sp. DJ247]MBC2580546.1 hypothetical protein [Clostridium sp. DJ247]